jgi:hypothetical protein
MNRLPLASELKTVAASAPPTWDQAPPERRRELTATLAAMILKQLPPRHSALSEDRDERP